MTISHAEEQTFVVPTKVDRGMAWLTRHRVGSRRAFIAPTRDVQAVHVPLPRCRERGFIDNCIANNA